MAPKEAQGIKIRHASLEDAAEICGIHRSQVDRWYRKLDNEQYEVPYSSLTPSERWGFGGPWMSIETCSVHLNNLLLQHQFPIVACDDDRPVGETELFTGKEGAPYGQNMHIGLLYVKRGHTGRGIGSALVDKALEMAECQDCDTVSVASAPANEGFYEKCGFMRSGTIVELEAAVEDYGIDVSPVPPPLNLWSFARGLPMRLGRWQSSAFHLFEQFDRYAIPEFLNVGRDRLFFTLDGHPSMLAFIIRDDTRADVYGWSGANTGSLTFAALSILHKKRVKYANLLLTSDDYYAISDRIDATIKGSRSTLLRSLK